MILATYKRRAAPYLTGEKPTFGTVLVSLLLRSYGTEALNWEGETIQMQIKQDYDVEMPRRVYDQLMGMITALTTDLVYTDVEVFDEVCNALCRRGVGSYRDIPPAIDVAWAVTEIEMADPAPVSRLQDRWADPIKRYIRVVLNDEGISFAPQTLSFVKDIPPNTKETSDPALFAASWMSKQESSNEIDNRVEEITQVMLGQLRDIGIQVPFVKSAKELLPDGTEIVEVDGNQIRNKKDIDFIGGSNSEANDYVPKKQIWVEKDLQESDKRKIVLHEIVERSLMRAQGMPYAQAHEIANEMEAKARKQDKSAEWTSPENRDTHVVKHAPEFGTPDDYLRAEEEHAAAPAGDEIAQDIRCKLTESGAPSCTMSYYSPSRGTLHVKRLADGRTVTLYKVSR
jgi:hypothetical protein